MKYLYAILFAILFFSGTEITHAANGTVKTGDSVAVFTLHYTYFSNSDVLYIPAVLAAEPTSTTKKLRLAVVNEDGDMLEGYRAYGLQIATVPYADKMFTLAKDTRAPFVLFAVVERLPGTPQQPVGVAVTYAPYFKGSKNGELRTIPETTQKRLLSDTVTF